MILEGEEFSLFQDSVTKIKWHAEGLLSRGCSKRKLPTGLNKAQKLPTSLYQDANFYRRPEKLPMDSVKEGV